MKKVFRWFFGYIDVRLYGHQVNRFINLCSKNGIHLWDISHDLQQWIRVHLCLRDFYALKPFLRKTKTKIKIMGRHGFPFWCHRHPVFKWFPALLAIALCAFGYSRGFIWEIRIQGNDQIAEYELLEVLEAKQVAVGSKTKVVDCDALEYAIRKRFTNIGWISVYMVHNRLCIDLRESLYGELKENSSDGNRYDLVANKDAYIHTMVTRFGTAVVSSDSYVKKGEVLVKGTFDVYDDSGLVKLTQKVRAEAYILGDVKYEISIPITELEIMSLKIAGEYTDSAIRRIGNKKLSYFLENLEENGVIILDKSVMIEKADRSIAVHGTIYAREPIGTNILVEDCLQE